MTPDARREPAHAPEPQEAINGAPAPENAPRPPPRRRGRPPATTPAAIRMRARRAASKAAPDEPKENTVSPRQRRKDGKVDVPLFDALLAHLPQADEAWTAERRRAWFALAAHVIGGSDA